MPGAGSARGDWANQAAEPPRSFARIIGVQTAARSCAEERVALMGGCTSVHRSFALFRGSARAGAVIPNEQIISGLRPIPRGALPSGTPHPAPASPGWDTHTPLRHPLPRPRFALLPRPREGAGAVMAISGGQPSPVLLRDLPLEWTVGISSWGEGTGEGETPSPQAGTRTFLLKVPAPPSGGSTWGYPGKNRLPGYKPPGSVKSNQYSPPLGGLRRYTVIRG